MVRTFVSFLKTPEWLWCPPSLSLQWVAGTVFLRIKRPEHKIDNLYIVPQLRMMGAIIPVHLWRAQRQLYKHEFERLGIFKVFLLLPHLLPQEELSKVK
jgi:hypothetical protein